MKVKTSVSLSEEVLQEIDEAVSEGGSRSEFLERLARQHFREQRKREAGQRDMAIYRSLSPALAEEALRNVEDFGVPWWELGDEVEVSEEG